uniref:Olfactory receptor family 4 subfamily P member 7 n=1 Tax=Jaculus jaculus TaxID=51337 RepID=A0A8C5LHB9_JACJA
MDYRNNVTEFILSGLSQVKEIEIICFLLFLLCYIAILIDNLFIMVSITCSKLIHQPMYFFQCYPSLSDPCYTSTVTPKLITDLLARKKSISYNGCMTQLFTLHFFGGIEVFILIGMAYDSYVTICKPLYYSVIFLLVIFLPYCDHYFCDVYPLLKLACTDTRKIGVLVIANSGLMGLVTFVVLLISYAVILYTIRSYSSENQHKALSTCSSHITLVVLSKTLPEDKVFALFYSIIAPMLNPLMYTLRNMDMKNAIKRLWLHILLRGYNRQKGTCAFHLTAS